MGIWIMWLFSVIEKCSIRLIDKRNTNHSLARYGYITRLKVSLVKNFVSCKVWMNLCSLRCALNSLVHHSVYAKVLTHLLLALTDALFASNLLTVLRCWEGLKVLNRTTKQLSRTSCVLIYNVFLGCQGCEQLEVVETHNKQHYVWECLSQSDKKVRQLRISSFRRGLIQHQSQKGKPNFDCTPLKMNMP